MIRSFGDSLTEEMFHGTATKRLKRLDQRVVSVAIRKLDMLNAAQALDDLRSPPGNRLEALRGDFQGMYSIRVNQQWRLVFRWSEGGCFDVRFVDYH